MPYEYDVYSPFVSLCFEFQTICLSRNPFVINFFAVTPGQVANRTIGLVFCNRSSVRPLSLGQILNNANLISLQVREAFGSNGPNRIFCRAKKLRTFQNRRHAIGGIMHLTASTLRSIENKDQNEIIRK